MFYSTTIKSVGGGGAVDVQGRRLTFLGYLPVKAGDTVYTDGRYIFGNAPPKGAPAVFDTPGGIPVLGDEYSLSTSDPKEELRGYVNKSGKYKHFRIAGDEWTTNAKKTYAHDGSVEGVDDANVIDAEIALDENGVYTVEKIVAEVGTDNTIGIKYLRDNKGYIYGYSNAPEIDNLGYFLDSDTSFTTRTRLLYISSKNADRVIKNDEQIKTCEIIIRKDGEEISRINVDDFAAPIVATAKKYVAVEVKGREPTDHLWTRTVVDNFKILPDGKWEAILTIEVLAERVFTAEPLILLRTGEVNRTETTNTVPISADTIFDEETYGSLANILNAFVSQFDSLTRPRSIIYTTYTFTVSEANPRKFTKEVANTFAHCVYTLKIKSDEENPETLFENVFIAPLFFFDMITKRIDDTDWQYTKSIPLSHGIQSPDDPYRGGMIFTMDFDRELIISDTLKDADIVANSDGNFIYPQVYEVGTGWWAAGTSEYVGVNQILGGEEQRTHNLHGVYFCNIALLYHSRNMLDAPDYDNPVKNLADDFSFPVQDDFTASIEGLQDDDGGGEDEYDEIEKVYWKLGGVYDKDSKRVVDGTDESFSGDEETAHQWNMSLATLKSGDYLFGIRDDQDRDIDGKLFKIDSGGNVAETFAERGFKNFRLRELKKISKAKK